MGVVPVSENYKADMGSAYMHPLFKTKWGGGRWEKESSWCVWVPSVCVCVCFILNQWKNRVGPMATYRKAAKKGARLWHTHDPPSLDFSLSFTVLNSRGPRSTPALPRVCHSHLEDISEYIFFILLPTRKQNDATKGSHKLLKHIRVTSVWSHWHSCYN